MVLNIYVSNGDVMIPKRHDYSNYHSKAAMILKKEKKKKGHNNGIKDHLIKKKKKLMELGEKKQYCAFVHDSSDLKK